MRIEISAYRWTCDDCNKEIITFDSDFPDGWDEVDDNPEGECHDRCEECLIIKPAT